MFLEVCVIEVQANSVLRAATPTEPPKHPQWSFVVWHDVDASYSIYILHILNDTRPTFVLQQA